MVKPVRLEVEYITAYLSRARPTQGRRRVFTYTPPAPSPPGDKLPDKGRKHVLSTPGSDVRSESCLHIFPSSR